jgi:hypothetical protein
VTRDTAKYMLRKKNNLFILYLFNFPPGMVSCPGLVLMAVGLRISLGAGSRQSLQAELILSFCCLQIISAQ